MPSKNPSQRLRDILENIDAIRVFSERLSLEDFARDRNSTPKTRALEIISEASRRLPDQLKNRHPEIDGSAVAAAGNVYRHEYEAVDTALVWHTIRQELEGLRSAVAVELERPDRVDS